MIALLRSAVERGSTVFETAGVYGPLTTKNSWVRPLVPFREEVVIATKFGWEANPGDGNSNLTQSAPTSEEIREVSPALSKYTQSSIDEDLWKRPELSPRDRAIVTVAALIARNQTIGMLPNFTLALDHGVRPTELSEIATHFGVLLGLAERPLRGGGS